jgi:topoisomerase-4 subunit A
MSEDNQDGEDSKIDPNQENELDTSGGGDVPADQLSDTKLISGFYQDWFLDYASYVILERAVPHINDGFKPVQRRILHSMKELEDGRYNKVANIVGNTMKYHPHGDMSISDALVQRIY